MVSEMNTALAPFTRTEFEQMRTLLQRLVDHLQLLEPPAASSPTDEGKRPTRRATKSASRKRK